jgi:hypothetical protein
MHLLRSLIRETLDERGPVGIRRLASNGTPYQFFPVRGNDVPTYRIMRAGQAIDVQLRREEDPRGKHFKLSKGGSFDSIEDAVEALEARLGAAG